MASRLITVIYVAMVMPIHYNDSYSPNDSNLSALWLILDLSIEFYGEWQKDGHWLKLGWLGLNFKGNHVITSVFGTT